MNLGGRLAIAGSLLVIIGLGGAFALAAPPDTAPYIPAFQDLEVSDQVADDSVRLGGEGFEPNSEVTVRITRNDTGDLVHESTELADATGAAEFDVEFDEAVTPGAYTATLGGTATNGESIQMTGGLSIAADFAPTTTAEIMAATTVVVDGSTTTPTSETEIGTDDEGDAPPSAADGGESERASAAESPEVSTEQAAADEASPVDGELSAATANDSLTEAGGSTSRDWILPAAFAVLVALAATGAFLLRSRAQAGIEGPADPPG